MRSISLFFYHFLSGDADRALCIRYLMADIANVSQAEVQSIYDAICKTRANILTRLLCVSLSTLFLYTGRR